MTAIAYSEGPDIPFHWGREDCETPDDGQPVFAPNSHPNIYFIFARGRGGGAKIGGGKEEKQGEKKNNNNNKKGNLPKPSSWLVNVIPDGAPSAVMEISFFYFFVLFI